MLSPCRLGAPGRQGLLAVRPELDLGPTDIYYINICFSLYFKIGPTKPGAVPQEHVLSQGFRVGAAHVGFPVGNKTRERWQGHCF